MERMDRDAGGKRRSKKKGGEIVRLAVVVWLLCVLSSINATRGEPGVTGLTAFATLTDARSPDTDTSVGTGETLVNIADESRLKQRYDQHLTGGDSIGVLPKNMVITKPIILGLPDGRTNISPVEIRIPKGPIKILAPKNLAQADIIIDNPNLFITGTRSMISVEEEECLALRRGQIQKNALDGPAIILRNQGILIWEEEKDFEGLKKTGIRNGHIDPPEPVPPDENQTGPEYGGTQPQLTEVVLLSIGANGSDSVRLEFKNLPSDINAFYMLRNKRGRSWKKGKNKVTAAPSQSRQETVKCGNFLKETGNTLNTSIVVDSYLVYRLQSGGGSFYMKAGIEWPGGSYETDKVRVAIPKTAGQGLTFSYGGGNCSYGGGYVGGYGSGLGGYGGDSTSGGDPSTQSDTQEESNTSEGPMRGRGGRRRDSYTPYSVPGYKDGGTVAGRITEEVIQEATPSKTRNPGEKDEDSDSQIQPVAGWEDTDTAG